MMAFRIQAATRVELCSHRAHRLLVKLLSEVPETSVIKPAVSRVLHKIELECRVNEPFAPLHVQRTFNYIS